MLTSLRSFFKEKGQGIVEYALLLAFVVGIALIALKPDGDLGKAVQSNFATTASAVTTFKTPST